MGKALTKAQKEVLEWIASQPHGVTDITEPRVVNALIDKGMVLRFYEIASGFNNMAPVWTITDAGRAALGAQP